MAGVCSKHQLYALDCKQCNTYAITGTQNKEIELLKNHFRYYVRLINMIQAQASAIDAKQNSADTEVLVEQLKILEETFRGRYD